MKFFARCLKTMKYLAVAITDHFKIDKDRIRHLRELSRDVVFFPAVELRTDKGSRNLHVIIIFSNKLDLDDLCGDFDAIMLRTKAKSRENDETIYWSFEDIVEFANGHNGLISIHAGKKTNGIDKEISNTLPVKEAIKADIAQSVNFFEVGRLQDMRDYQEHVFPVTGEKPVIMCSDCHDPRYYTPKEMLWIKGELTFEGLKQCLYQPAERVFLGLVPPTVDRVRQNKQVHIDSINVHRIISPVNTELTWFDFSIPLNPGLVTVIGNKGSGKSALSDIIGHLCQCSTMGQASFLNKNRFRKTPKNYSADYNATITWADGKQDTFSLGTEQYTSTVEDAQYLPQKYIEEVCNDIGDTFQREIDKVIFSYVDYTERSEVSSLQDLVEQRSHALSTEATALVSTLQTLNTSIIKLEAKKTSAYSKQIDDGLKKKKESLERHDKSKPIEVKKPESKDGDAEYQAQLEIINTLIENIQQRVTEKRKRLTEINVAINDIADVLVQIGRLTTIHSEVHGFLYAFIEKYNINYDECTLSLTTPKTFIENFRDKLLSEKETSILEIENQDDGFEKQLIDANSKKTKLISEADTEEKKYQKYLKDLDEWEITRDGIIGTADTEDTLSYFEYESVYLSETLEHDYSKLCSKREEIFYAIYNIKKNLVSVYEHIYAPIEGEIANLLGNLEDNIVFQAEIQLNSQSFGENILNYINQKFAGVFKGTKESHVKMDSIIRETDFSNSQSILCFIQKVLQTVHEDIDASEKKVADKQGLYDLLFNLSYISVSFKLKMGGRDLSELSPGERGIVLLIFFLALSKNNTPIIIDQPEDNLDNQSVFSKLVPCICRAKQKRQVIIVTHNPNIAVACDAEQIIYCCMDKNKTQIQYTAGAIENPVIRNHVVDVLEGTMPAFDLRRQKYD